jgi:hypothetical protein
LDFEDGCQRRKNSVTGMPLEQGSMRESVIKIEVINLLSTMAIAGK